MGRAAARGGAGATVDDDAVEAVNEVRLVGRVSGQPDERELPSGDRVVVFRLVVARDDGRPDTLDCAVFRGDLRRKARGWVPGDVVAIDGALRRRFFRAGGAPASRYEVEVAGATRVRRAPG
ncbi:MAG TPA: single-stranded DNA-binding protein [Candidatus Nanopelagicales bacterium]|nr:single-stranded DNA-binding protein [Candidatus Nanopelagicales bacterium]